MRVPGLVILLWARKRRECLINTWVHTDFYLIIVLRIKVIDKYRNEVECNYDASDNKW